MYRRVALSVNVLAAAWAGFATAAPEGSEPDNASEESTAAVAEPEGETRAEASETEPEVEAKAGEGLSGSGFVDAYVGLQTGRIGTAAPAHRAYALAAMDDGDNLVNENGFSLSWAGLDLGYRNGPVGAAVSLRAGPSLPVYYGTTTMGQLGLDSLTQAYVTWNPAPIVELSFGQFVTVFGAEVAESWLNLNYTRGGLYMAMQLFWHTGLRADFRLSDVLELTVMGVNGVNTVSETQEGNPVFLPTPGAQLRYQRGPLRLAVGGLYGPETEGDGFNLFFDFVAALDLEPLTLLFNADYKLDGHAEADSTSFYGLSLAGGMAVTPILSLAGRLEYLVDADNSLNGVPDPEALPLVELLGGPVSITTATLTFDIKPVPDSDVLVVRWDNRYELSNQDVYTNTDGDADSGWFSTVLGVVVQGD